MLVRLIRRRAGCYFFLDKKVTKKSRQQNASLPTGLCAQTAQNLRATLSCPAVARPIPCFCNTLMPLSHTATAVLPSFSRSCLLSEKSKALPFGEGWEGSTPRGSFYIFCRFRMGKDRYGQLFVRRVSAFAFVVRGCLPSYPSGYRCRLPFRV